MLLHQEPLQGMLPLTAAGIKGCAGASQTGCQTGGKGTIVPLASTGTLSVAPSSQIPLNVAFRRALLLPRVQGANFLAQSCREGQTCPGGACKASGTGLGQNPGKLGVCSTSPWPWERGWVAAQPLFLMVLDCIPGINGKYFIVPFVSIGNQAGE